VQSDAACKNKRLELDAAAPRLRGAYLWNACVKRQKKSGSVSSFIPSISIQWMADVVEVRTDLMHATGDGCDEEQRIRAAAAGIRNVKSHIQCLRLQQR
jgi:hypothetical protein